MENVGCPFADIRIRESELDFKMVEGSPTPPAMQALHVEMVSAGNAVNSRWTIALDTNWLHLVPNHGQGPAEVWVIIDSVSEPVGENLATASLTSPDAPNLNPPNAPPTSLKVPIKLTVTPKPQPLIVTASLPDGTQGELYQAQIQVKGGTPPYNVTCSGLPDGVTFVPEMLLISGTPTVSGQFTITVSVEDSSTPVQKVSQPYTINIAEAPPPPPTYKFTMAVSGPPGCGSVVNETPGPYHSGDLLNIKAAASQGFQFVNWTAPAGEFFNPNLSGTVFTMPAQDVTVTGNFEPVPTKSWWAKLVEFLINLFKKWWG